MVRPELPARQRPPDDRGYFEVITRLVFQSGFSWGTVQRRWPAFAAAFDRFEPERVRRYDAERLTALAENPAIVRNRQKIEATVANADAVCRLADDHGSVGAWLSGLRSLPWDARLKAVAAPFRFIGPSGAHWFLWCVDEPVPGPPGRTAPATASRPEEG